MRPITDASTVYLTGQAIGFTVLNSYPRLDALVNSVTQGYCNRTVLRDGVVQRMAGLIQTLGIRNDLFGENSATLAPLACQAFVDNPVPLARVLLRKTDFVHWLAYHIPPVLFDDAISLALGQWAIRKVLFSNTTRRWAQQPMEVDLSVNMIAEWIDYGLSGAPTPSLQQACEHESAILQHMDAQYGDS